jgi:membrane protein
MGFLTFLRRLYKAHGAHAVSTSAAALTYYLIFSLFPFLFFLVTLAAFLPIAGSVQMLLARVRPIMPKQAMGLVEQHIMSLLAQPHAKLLTAGVALALYSASRGFNAFREGMNLAYGVPETRSFVRTQALAIGLTIGVALLVLLGVIALVIGGDAGLWLARHLGIMSEWLLVWRWLRWPVALFAVMVAVAVVYHLLPNVRQRFHFITAGSAFATLAWLVATWGFGVYVSHFGKYNVTYGSIGGVIILMTWLFMSAFIFLLGGEINAILVRPADAEAPATGDEPAPAAPDQTAARGRGSRAAPPGPRPPHGPRVPVT